MNFTLPASPSPKAAPLNVKRDLLTLLSPIEDSESMRMSIQLFFLYRMLLQSPTFSHPIQNAKVCGAPEGGGKQRG